MLEPTGQRSSLSICYDRLLPHTSDIPAVPDAVGNPDARQNDQHNRVNKLFNKPFSYGPRPGISDDTVVNLPDGNPRFDRTLGHVEQNKTYQPKDHYQDTDDDS